MTSRSPWPARWPVRWPSGARVTLVTATLGEQGEVIGDELAGLVADRADQLGGYRYTELRSACAALGVADHRMLVRARRVPRFRDGRDAVGRASPGVRPGRVAAAPTTLGRSPGWSR